MSIFQSKFNVNPPYGWPGDRETGNPLILWGGGRFSFIAGENLPVGGFCWLDPDHETIVLSNGTGKPIGFVPRYRYGTDYSFDGENGLIIYKGSSIQPVVKGDFFIDASNLTDEVENGDPVMCDPKTGLICDSSASGAVETGYFYKVINGKVFSISAWDNK